MAEAKMAVPGRMGHTAAEPQAPSAGSARAPVSDEATSSPDTIFKEVLQGLYDGRYVPGQRLIEADLSRTFRVSRGSVREALRRLAAEGVVELTLHKGAYIRILSRNDARDVARVMEVMIGLAAQLAAERCDDEGEALLRGRYTRLAAFKDGPDFIGFIRARNSFYRALVRIGQSQELARLLPSMHVHLVRIQFRQYYTPAEEARFEDYREMTEAVVARDSVRAERAGRAHIRRIFNEIDNLPDGAFPNTG